jgi:hypothetical protein
VYNHGSPFERSTFTTCGHRPIVQVVDGGKSLIIFYTSPFEVRQHVTLLIHAIVKFFIFIIESSTTTTPPHLPLNSVIKREFFEVGIWFVT